MQLSSKQFDLMSFLELDKSCPLKAEHFSGTTTALILDKNGDVLAKQMIIKYSPSQAYCIFSECNEKIVGNDIRVEEDKDTNHLKLVSIETERENRRLLPLFVQFHTQPEARPAEAHLIDHLAENTLGRFNLELRKNITHDSFVVSESWRDEAGFILTDRNCFVYVTFRASDLLSTLQPNLCECGSKIAEYNAKDFEALCDFDSSVCGFSRREAVEFVASNSSILVAKGDDGIDGIIAYKGNKILALYAETKEIAHNVMKNYIKKNRPNQISFFTRKNTWDCKPVASREVHRRHTRTVPSGIKWDKVYALNMGFHIV